MVETSGPNRNSGSTFYFFGYSMYNKHFKDIQYETDSIISYLIDRKRLSIDEYSDTTIISSIINNLYLFEWFTPIFIPESNFSFQCFINGTLTPVNFEVTNLYGSFDNAFIDSSYMKETIFQSIANEISNSLTHKSLRFLLDSIESSFTLNSKVENITHFLYEENESENMFEDKEIRENYFLNRLHNLSKNCRYQPNFIICPHELACLFSSFSRFNFIEDTKYGIIRRSGILDNKWIVYDFDIDNSIIMGYKGNIPGYYIGLYDINFYIETKGTTNCIKYDVLYDKKLINKDIYIVGKWKPKNS
jgi:hypothetical protein